MICTSPPFSLEGLFHSVVPRELLAFVVVVGSDTIFRIALNEIPVIVRKTQEAHQLMLRFGDFQVRTASTASGSGLMPCLSIILPRYLIDSLSISHFDGFHFNPEFFMQASTSSSRSI